MPNRLASETSPYLLQHAHNPVDWYPWGPEAFQAARAQQKPIFLSIGYSACHWCHVMEHESFEDPQIAAQLNRDFIPIKVDREERPDLDQIYMHALHGYFQLTGSPQGGGWPLSMFLTPDLRPFFGGTYWPPRSKYGRPGFADVLARVAEFWREHREQAHEQAAALTHYVRMEREPQQGELSPVILRLAVDALERNFDHRHGGFGGAPKFPHPLDVRVLLRAWRRERRAYWLEMAQLTLRKMAQGGIYDQLGGGFHRYSVDEQWLVPHFEKMLYDNAMLAAAYVEAYQATGQEDFARVARETCDYVLREMTHPLGGFYSTQDADSEGEEGKFYLWTPREIQEVLGEAAGATFCRVYDVSEAGNFEHRNILNLPKTLAQCAALLQRDERELAGELALSRRKLLAARARRVAPGLDDKIIVAWNGLMIDALSQAACALDEARYAKAAQSAADFLLSNLRREDGRLLHVWRQGEAKFPAYLDDYACLANALVSLYEAVHEERYVESALQLAQTMLAHFADRERGGFFYTADDHEQLIARQKDFQDNPIPSGNGMAATVLLRLGKLCGQSEFLAAAQRVLEQHTQAMERAPMAVGQMLLALDFHLGPAHEIALLADPAANDTLAMLRALHRRYVPNKLLAVRKPGAAGGAALERLFAGKEPIAGEPTAYVCRNFTCQAPHVGREAISRAWEELELRTDM